MRQPELGVSIGAKLLTAVSGLFASISLPEYLLADSVAVGTGAFLSMAPRADGEPIQPTNFLFGVAAGLGAVILMRSGDFADIWVRGVAFGAAIVGTHIPTWLREPEKGAAVIKSALDVVQKIIAAISGK